MTLKKKEFNLIKAEKEAAQPKKRQVNVVKRSNTSGPRARLDLRGKRYEEAMQELDGFIDQALLNNMAQVDIIHGIGTGVIREGWPSTSAANKHVKSFEYAPKMQVEVARLLLRLKDKSSPSFSLARFRLKKSYLRNFPWVSTDVSELRRSSMTKLRYRGRLRIKSNRKFDAESLDSRRTYLLTQSTPSSIRFEPLPFSILDSG